MLSTQQKPIQGFQISQQQKRLWLLQQSGFNVPSQVTVKVVGELRSHLLKPAINRAIEKHDILRTQFPRPSGLSLPVQVIEEAVKYTWRELSIADLNEESIAEIVADNQEIEAQECKADTHLSLRICQISVSLKVHFLIFTLSSLWADRQSLDNLVREIAIACDVQPLNAVTDSTETIQYLQFSEWQNESIDDNSTFNPIDYLQSSDIAISQLEKPTPSNKILDRIEWKLDRNLTSKISAIEEVEVFILAAWAILLGRLNDRQCVGIANLVSGRDYPELIPVMGVFAKYVPVTFSWESDITFRDAIANFKSPSNSIDSSTLPPEFTFPFAFEYRQKNSYRSANLSWQIVSTCAFSDRCKIQLTCIQTENELSLELAYDSQIYSQPDIQKLSEYLQTIVESAADSPETKISQLTILSDRDRQQLLVQFNQTQKDFPQNKCLHHLFEEQVKRVPNNIAVVCEEERLTYSQLDARANCIASHLQRLGARSDTIVAISADRSTRTIAAILGVLKAGAAYLPIEPSLPPEVIAKRLEDAKVTISIDADTNFKSEENIYQTQTGKAILNPKSKIQNPKWYDTFFEPSDAANFVSSPPHLDSLAYVIYTSGTAGKPKGVAVERRQVLNYLYGIKEKLDLPDAASYAVVSTLAADLGYTAIFPALCGGGCLHIITRDRATNPQAFADYCQKNPIDCLKIVPSHLEALLSSPRAAELLPSQRLILGGEACQWELIRKIRQLAPDLPIYNHYGPTEATIGAIAYPIADIPPSPASATVPLGKAIANVQVYLLDRHLQPVPIGVPGEIYIGGAGLARGYLNQPELTQNKFIPHPFIPGDRLYRTGDLASFHPDGNLEFIGRTDNQVKIRGYRLELEEIETAICQHPLISQAVALLTPDSRLVAYFISRGNPLEIEELRRFLQSKLPEYAIPSIFIPLKSLPLNPNGKVDRNALPKLEETALHLPENKLFPREVLELQLAQIWEELLNIPSIGVSENFFKIGGHSLLAVRLLSAIEKRLHSSISLNAFLQNPTIEGLAIALRQQPNPTYSSSVCLQPKGDKKPFFCIHPIGGNVICYYQLANYFAPDRPFYGLEAPGFYGECKPYSNIEDLAKHHLESILSIQPKGSYYIGGWSMGGVVALEVARQLTNIGREVNFLALLDTQPPLSAYKSDSLQHLTDAQLLADIAIATADFQQIDSKSLSEKIDAIASQDRLFEVLEFMKQLKFVPPDIELNKIRKLLEVYRANNRILIDYLPKDVAHKISLFISESNRESDIINLDSKPFLRDWHKLASKQLEVYPISGDHASMLVEPHVKQLARQLRDCLYSIELSA